MKTVKIHKAISISETPVESVVIYIDHEINLNQSTGALNETHGENALDLADALFSTLPGATIDRLLIEILERKASSLCISPDCEGQ